MVNKSRRLPGRQRVWAPVVRTVQSSRTITPDNNKPYPQEHQIFITQKIVENSQTGDLVPIKYRVRDFRAQVGFNITGDRLSSLVSQFNAITAYIVKVPEGLTLDYDTPQNHPEWILAYRVISSQAYSSTGEYVLPVSFRTGKQMSLFSGDCIYLMVSAPSPITFIQSNPPPSIQLVMQGAVGFKVASN